jgi:hypothetical protein
MYFYIDIQTALGYALLARPRRIAMPNNFRDDLIAVLETVSKAQLHALRRLRGRPAEAPRGEAGKRLERMSHVDMVYDILQSVGRPLHISAILTEVNHRYQTSLDRESIVSALAKRVARRDRFARTGPNTFALLPEKER